MGTFNNEDYLCYIFQMDNETEKKIYEPSLWTKDKQMESGNVITS